ncbi:hypothetical protein ACFIOZ_20380 [Vreelandella sp. F11]|uniref:hypothetical protein n=1 Tax=Vreelandella sp. F11 TaxID=3394751 RepID=UPI0036DA7A69
MSTRKTELRAQIRLRPTRIGFLVNPSDKKSLRKIMRINACLWGGLYNPIIPVYTKTPKEWLDSQRISMKGKDVAQGYIRFFDPDVYVEAEEGLLKKTGLESFQKGLLNKKSILLDDFFENEFRGEFEPQFGQSVFDILEDIYISERRFMLRDELPAIYSSQEDLFSEICIGCYPKLEQVHYLKSQFYEVYKPVEEKLNPELWLKVYGGKCETPFTVTNKHFEVFRTWQDDPIIYVFNPSNSKDIIDLWNLRIQPAPIFPVPIKWMSYLADPIRKFINNNYIISKENSNITHRVTIQKSRSISESQAKEEILPHFNSLQNNSYIVKNWHTSIWEVNYRNHFFKHPEKAKITSEESDQIIELKEGSSLGVFKTLAPTFAQRFSGSSNRWANVAKISSPYEGSNIALSLPFNTLDRSWPNQGINELACGREGWVFLQDHKSENEFVSFIKHEDAFSSWFKKFGIDTRCSEAGRIAKQVIDSLGGINGLYLFNDKESIQFINKHASSTRKRTINSSGDVIEEDFSGRSSFIDDWQAMIKRRKSNGSYRLAELSHYIRCNVIKVGIESECDHCGAKNWHSLDEVSYDLRCLRCLKHYKFPQGNLRQHNKNWKYRVIGPFAVPDYAQGAYASLLTIKFFINMMGHDTPKSYSTALELVCEKQKTEIDFAIWIPEERGFDINGEPRLIIGEAKSFGEDIIKDNDLDKLKKSASIIPESIIVISVLKDSFSKEEKKRLIEFVSWAREPVNSRPRHWVILLTGTELFNDFLERTWKNLGEPYSTNANFHSTHYLEQLSDATQSIYLDIDYYYTCLDDKENFN